MPRTDDLDRAATALRDLVTPGDPVVLPNVWDPVSARLVEQAGFPALATSSAAVAATFGFPDDDSMDPDIAFAAVARVAASSTLPVTADIEAGYGLDAGELAERLVRAGACGCNLEDTDHRGEQPLVPAEAHTARIAELKDAARALGVDLVVNARTDVFLRQVGTPDEQLDEMVHRGRRYLEAGADSVFPLGVADENDIARLVEAIGGPVNVLRYPGVPDVPSLARLGVARVSLGSGLFKQAKDAVRAALEGLREGGADSSP